MRNKKKFVIEGTKKQKILLVIQLFLIIFMLAFAVIGKHVLKIEDSAIFTVIDICVPLIIAIMAIILLLEKDHKDDKNTKKNKDNN